MVLEDSAEYSSSDEWSKELNMHAAVLRGLGAAPRCEQFADPVPPGDELIVEVRASSLKPVDKQLARLAFREL